MRNSRDVKTCERKKEWEIIFYLAYLTKMALHLSKDFLLQDWVTAVLGLVPAKNLLLLERAEKGGNIESEELSYYSQQQVARAGKAMDSAEAAWTTLKVDADLWERLTAGYLLMVGEEVIKVTAVGDKSGSGSDAYYPLTVVRWYGSTPASAISANAIVKIMSKAEKEEWITEDYKAVGSVKYTNVIQDFSKTIYVTKRAAILRKKDMDDLIDLERLAKFDEMSQEIDKTLYYGRQNKNPDGDTRTTMGWWKEAIANANGVIFNANSAITEDDFEACLLTIAQRYGEPEGIFCNAWTKNELRKAFKNKVYVEDRANHGAGTRLTRFVSDSLGYDLPFMIDNQIENGHIFIWKARPLIHVMKDREFGNDIFFAFYRESSSSKVIYESLQSSITAEFQYANQDAFIYNVAAGSKAPTEVVIKNTADAPVIAEATIVNEDSDPVPTKEITG